ncbi:colicin Z C-terminal domain-related protein [Photorhabdus laumondii]|uniref:colicin Z C-terminal domain-related protein n=1 Tax=Photorhabdus laumondii TaxID=2218628 RepID=UPI003315C7D4
MCIYAVTVYLINTIRNYGLIGKEVVMTIRQGWAPPLTWGPWVDLRMHSGISVYTISFDTDSSAPSAFGVEIEYPVSTGVKRISTTGPGSHQITDNNGAGTDRIRFKSYSIGQVIRIIYNA